MSEATETALVPVERDIQAALRHALRLWAEASTAPSTERREEIQGYKQKVVNSFSPSSRSSRGRFQLSM